MILGLTKEDMQGLGVARLSRPCEPSRVRRRSSGKRPSGDGQAFGPSSQARYNRAHETPG